MNFTYLKIRDWARTILSVCWAVLVISVPLFAILVAWTWYDLTSEIDVQEYNLIDYNKEGAAEALADGVVTRWELLHIQKD